MDCKINMEKVIFDVAGMRCGACAIGIELALAKRKGVKSAKVSLNERMAVVEYDPAIVAASDIAKAVNDLGYIATARR
jgi:copper chaperone CopZ